jgi:hypothetical protein
VTRKATNQSPIFSAIEAHRRALKELRQVSRACELLKKKYPKLAPHTVPTWKEIPALDDSRRAVWERDQDTHKKERKLAGVQRAERVDYEATIKARAKLRDLCNLRPVNIHEAAAMANHLLRNLEAEVGDFSVSGKYATMEEMEGVDINRAMALYWILKLLRRIAEASEKKKPNRPKNKAGLRLAA